MNENLNLCQILKDCPKWTKLWSPIWGDVFLNEIKDGSDSPIKLTSVCSSLISLYSNGKMFDLEEAECVVFPSKDQRDWSKFKPKKERFDPKTLHPFDKVLVRNDDYWIPTIFSYYHKWNKKFITILNKEYCKCIPYNNDTAHLAGTTDDAPEYYKWWKK